MSTPTPILHKWLPLALALAIPIAGYAQSSSSSAAQDDATQLSGEAMAKAATDLLKHRMNQPATERVPLIVRHEAKCIAVFPEVTKVGMVIAGKSGHGLVSCRQPDSGAWGVPVFYQVTGASVGLQAGVQTSNLMLLVVDEAGVQKLLEEKVEFGGDVSVAAGPVGAEAGARTGASILSYSRTKGVFAGVDIGGSTISFDKEANAAAYGHDQGVKALLFQQAISQGTLKDFRDTLNDYAPSRQ